MRLSHGQAGVAPSNGTAAQYALSRAGWSTLCGRRRVKARWCAATPAKVSDLSKPDLKVKKKFKNITLHFIIKSVIDSSPWQSHKLCGEAKVAGCFQERKWGEGREVN